MASSGKPKSRSRSASSASKSRSASLSSSLSRSRSRSRSNSSERDGYRLHIADIGDDVRKRDLEKIFAPYGELREVWLTNSRPCFGFAVFKDKKDAAIALKACDGADLCGTRIRVSYARPRTRGQGRRLYSNNMRCYQCGYNGHFYRDCPEITGGSDSRKDRHMVLVGMMFWLVVKWVKASQLKWSRWSTMVPNAMLPNG
ncbi:serine/arginine-rich splicing factor 7-like isoform X2 [Euwallacea similis]|uniref:serine/arginine-rich splicing factor 7-like isoform X2 n=1 Tax=Euwallacea similis TaxID=1736056 RepID=UPI00344D5DE0